MACSRVNFISFYLQERIRKTGSEHMLLYATRSEKKRRTVTKYAATNGTYTSIQKDVRHDSVPPSCGLICSLMSLVSLISCAITLLYSHTFKITVLTKYLKHNLKYNLISVHHTSECEAATQNKKYVITDTNF